MKRILILLLTAVCGLACAESPGSDAGNTPQIIKPRLILAMDRILPGATENEIKARLPEEARAVLNLYLAGQVQQWYFRQDRPGVVLLLQVDSEDGAQTLVDSLPMSRAGLLAYDLVPLGPYIPLATLLHPPAPAKPAKKKAN